MSRRKWLSSTGRSSCYRNARFALKTPMKNKESFGWVLNLSLQTFLQWFLPHVIISNLFLLVSVCRSERLSGPLPPDITGSWRSWERFGFNPVSRPADPPSLPLKPGFVCVNVKGTQDFLSIRFWFSSFKKKPFCKTKHKMRFDQNYPVACFVSART